MLVDYSKTEWELPERKFIPKDKLFKATARLKFVIKIGF